MPHLLNPLSSKPLKLLTASITSSKTTPFHPNHNLSTIGPLIKIIVPEHSSNPGSRLITKKALEAVAVDDANTLAHVPSCNQNCEKTAHAVSE